MKQYSREIEKKFVLRDMGYEEAMFLLSKKYTMTALSTSVDRFWQARGVDFIRLRENSREMTVKVTDKEDITDRIEENVVVEDVDVAYDFLTLVYGEPCLTLTKTFVVFKAGEAVLCLYAVLEDPARRVFFEAEADSIEKVNTAVLEARLPLIPEKRSLFQIFMYMETSFKRLFDKKHLNRDCKKLEGPCTCGAWHSEAELKEWRP
jgi:hypothetical protein